MEIQPPVIQPQQHNIREIRFGKPFSYKTRQVVLTYPKPMMLINTDFARLVSVPEVFKNPNDVMVIPRNVLPSYLKMKKEELPKVLVIDYVYNKSKKLSIDSKVSYSGTTAQELANDVNLMLDHCPFASVVVDNLSGINDAMIGIVGQMNPDLMKDPRKWGGMAGAKIQEMVGAYFSLESKVVVIIAHESTRENDITHQTATHPYMVSQLRERIGNMATHFVYADTIEKDGKISPLVRVKPYALMKGLGSRFGNIDKDCDGSFESLYGKW